MGYELFSKRSGSPNQKTLWDRLCQLPQKMNKLRRLVAFTLVATVDGKRGYHALREGYFRQSGEVHRWMYDGVTLCHLLTEVGFYQAKACTATTSQIPSFNRYELDAVGEKIRKPDSLFVEAITPTIASSQAA